jgi:Zn finger protein HypA/HybF involved in hydrogenase expression
MKEEILSIASDLREGYMTTNEAKEHLLRLFGVSKSVCNCRVCGKETDYDLKDKLCPNCW